MKKHQVSICMMSRLAGWHGLDVFQNGLVPKPNGKRSTAVLRYGRSLAIFQGIPLRSVGYH